MQIGVSVAGWSTGFFLDGAFALVAIETLDSYHVLTGDEISASWVA
jgi:hypothetical protein